MRDAFKRLGRIALALVIVAVFAWGFLGVWTYVLPFADGKLGRALDSPVADRTEVLLEGAAAAYDAGRFDEAKKALELALETLVDRSGRYRPSDKPRLEKVRFLLGKTYQRLEVVDKAISEYEDTLRLNPNHYDAKYNLEMLKQQSSGGGAGSGTPKGGKKQPKI